MVRMMSDAYKTIARLRADRQEVRENLAHIRRELDVSREWAKRWKAACRQQRRSTALWMAAFEISKNGLDGSAKIVRSLVAKVLTNDL